MRSPPPSVPPAPAAVRNGRLDGFKDWLAQAKLFAVSLPAK